MAATGGSSAPTASRCPEPTPRRRPPAPARLLAPALRNKRMRRLLVARGDAEDRDDLGLLGLGVGDVGARAASEPARALVLADVDPGMALAVAVLDPDLVALLEASLGVVHGSRLSAWNSGREADRPHAQPARRAQLEAVGLVHRVLGELVEPWCVDDDPPWLASVEGHHQLALAVE